MEPGSLVMERKMLLGIKRRAEHLVVERAASLSIPHCDLAATEDGVVPSHDERQPRKIRPSA
jgi:hypothetical protein